MDAVLNLAMLLVGLACLLRGYQTTHRNVMRVATLLSLFANVRSDAVHERLRGLWAPIGR